MKKIYISGLANIETTCKVKEFPVPYFPIDYPFFKVNSSCSGVGTNLSLNFKSLDNRVTLVSLIGNDLAGKSVLNELKENKVNTKYVYPVLKGTAQSVVLYDQDGKREIYCDLKDYQERGIDFEDSLKELISSDIVICTNSNFNRPLLKLAREYNKKIATDVHVIDSVDDPYNREFMMNADIIFLSDEKLDWDLEKFLLDLNKEYHPQIIVLGRGNKGALMYVPYESKFVYIDAILIREIVSTVGAGDALFSGFINYYIKGYSPIESLKRAEIIAAYKIGEYSGSKGFLSEEEVEEYYANQRFNVWEKIV